MQQFQLLNQQQQPYIQGGYGALSRLNTLLGLSPRPNAALSGAGNAYMPTPSGGVQPIMTNGSTYRLNDPYIGGSTALNRILMLRAAHGDTQAGQMLTRMQ